MTAERVLARAKSAGLTLAYIGGRLRVTPAGLLSEDLQAEIVEHRAEIIELLEYDRDTERALVNVAIKTVANSGAGYDPESFELLNQQILEARAAGDLLAVKAACDRYVGGAP